jgi:hypothetical protein
MATTWGRGTVLAALASSALLLAGCQTETTFHPATGSGFYSDGYSERQLQPGRWIVSFQGNSVTGRDTVERYLFFRAAQLTLQQGFDNFLLADRDTKLRSRTYSTPGAFGPGFGGFGYGGFGGYWGPSWRYHGGGFGWRSWDPWFGGYGPWGGGFDVNTIDKYEATADIMMRKGPIPQGDVRAFDARKVVETIGPSVVLPGQDRRR